LDIRTFGNTNVTCYFMRHLSILILILILTGCVSRTDQKKIVICYNYKGFFTDTLTLKVDQRKFAMIIDSLDKPLDTNEGLLLSKDFQNIFENPRLYLNNVIKFLSDSSKTKGEKTIAIMTMQRKDYYKNLNFLYACDYLYRQDLVDEDNHMRQPINNDRRNKKRTSMA
jgi:hypothetical protein